MNAMTLMCFALLVNMAGVQHAYLRVLGVCSVVHSLLPPWDWDAAFFNDFPVIKSGILRMIQNRWYKVFVKTVGVLALNGRSLVWPSIQMPAQISRMQNTQP